MIPSLKERLKPSPIPQQPRVSCGLDTTSSKYRKRGHPWIRHTLNPWQGEVLFSISVCWMVVMVSCYCYFFFFSESQESAEWFHHKIWPSFLFLGGNEFMPKSLEWTYKDQEAKRSQRQPTEDSNMNKINLSSKTCIQSWENNSSELEKCVKTVK